MRQTVFIIVSLFLSAAYGQTGKQLYIPTYKNNKSETDTSLWYIWSRDLAKQINLKDLQTSTDTFHFRFWTDVQALDIWTTDHKLYFGVITNYAQRYDEKFLKKGISQIGKIYSNQIGFDSSKARKLFNLIDTLSIVSIPSDNDIPGWRPGLDGEEYLIETSSPGRYDFKTYWTPRIYADSLKEARQIQSLVDYLTTEFKMYNYYQKLNLPAGQYRRNGVQGIEITPLYYRTPGIIRATDLFW